MPKLELNHQGSLDLNSNGAGPEINLNSAKAFLSPQDYRTKFRIVYINNEIWIKSHNELGLQLTIIFDWSADYFLDYSSSYF